MFEARDRARRLATCRLAGNATRLSSTLHAGAVRKTPLFLRTTHSFSRSPACAEWLIAVLASTISRDYVCG